MIRLTDEQREIVARLRSGERLAGPVTIRRRTHYSASRPWGWPDGRIAHAGSVEGLQQRGVIQVVRSGSTQRAELLEESRP